MLVFQRKEYQIFFVPIKLSQIYFLINRDERRNYHQVITEVYNRYEKLDGDAFINIVSQIQEKFVKMLNKKPTGTALNEALCENAFTLAVCIANRIPVYIGEFFLNIFTPGTTN